MEAAELEAVNMREMTVNKRELIANDLRKDWQTDFDKPVSLITPRKAKEGDFPTMPAGTLRRFFQMTINAGKNPDQPIITDNDDWAAWMEGFYLMRVNWVRALIDPRRDYESECGYPPIIIPKQYRYMYDRVAPASRIVNFFPDECWAIDPRIYDTDTPEIETDFEKTWEDLCLDGENNPLHYMWRVDQLSGIGRYGILLFGTDDGEDLSVPLPGLDERGQPTNDRPKKPFKILFQRPFDEMMAHIINYERDPSNPRFGRPVFYHIIFADIRVGEPGMTAAAISVTSRIVHWTRVIHIADNRESSEVFGVPRMQHVFNNLCDVRKILGGSAEMFWKGGFPGYSFELNPDLVTAGATLDEESMKRQFQDYSNGLQRYLAVVGLTAKSLAPQVADPSPTLRAQMEVIAMTKNIPLSHLLGEDAAKIASGETKKTLNRQLMRRQKRYLTPMVIKPVINRYITLGILPPPDSGTTSTGTFKFKVRWPDINIPNEEERSMNADRIASGLMKYVMGGAYQVVPPYEFFTLVLGFTPDEAKVMEKAAKAWAKKPGWKIEPPNKGKAGDSSGGGGGNNKTRVNGGMK